VRSTARQAAQRGVVVLQGLVIDLAADGAEPDAVEGAGDRGLAIGGAPQIDRLQGVQLRLVALVDRHMGGVGLTPSVLEGQDAVALLVVFLLACVPVASVLEMALVGQLSQVVGVGRLLAFPGVQRLAQAGLGDRVVVMQVIRVERMRNLDLGLGDVHRGLHPRRSRCGTPRPF
jgi:hypothetical protein